MQRMRDYPQVPAFRLAINANDGAVSNQVKQPEITFPAKVLRRGVLSLSACG